MSYIFWCEILSAVKTICEKITWENGAIAIVAVNLIWTLILSLCGVVREFVESKKYERTANFKDIGTFIMTSLAILSAICIVYYAIFFGCKLIYLLHQYIS